MAVLQHSTTPSRTSSATSITATFSVLPTAGNSIIVGVWGSSSSTVTGSTCADNQSPHNTFTRDNTHQRTGLTGSWTQIWRCHNIVVNAGTFTVTVSGLPAGSEINIVATEVPSLTNAAPDATNSNDSTTGAPTTGSITPTQTGDYVFACVSIETGANPATITTPSGYNSEAKETNGASFEAGEVCDLFVSGTTAQNPAWNNLSVQWSASIAAYKATAAVAAWIPFPELNYLIPKTDFVPL